MPANFLSSNKRRWFAVALSLASALTIALSGLLSPQPAPRYTVTDLGTLPGYPASGAHAVNSRGDVAGFATRTGLDNTRACLSHGGKLIDLGVLPGGSSSFARGINAQGEVTGDASLHGSHHAFLYSRGKIQDLGTLPGFHDSAGVGINDRGGIAVNATNSGRQTGAPRHHAFLYSQGKMTDLPLPPGCLESRAVGINSAGQITGNCLISGRFSPFLYDGRTRTMTVLALPAPYTLGTAHRANDGGQIIGYVLMPMPNGSSHAALWHGKQVSDLGTPPGATNSIGEDLNNRGEVVGFCFSEDGPVKTFLRNRVGGVSALRRYLDRDTEHAFVYRDGKMQDLNGLIPRDADWTLVFAQGINDRGQIVGQGFHHGLERAFLLTPR